MANAQPSGDVSQRGPAEYLDPLAPLSSQFQQLQSLLELVFDDYEEFIRELTDDILSTPREERFTQSHEILREHVERRFGSTDAFAAVLPESNPQKIPAVLDKLVNKLLDDLLEGVFFQRSPNDHLVLAALFQGVRHGVRRVEDNGEEVDKEQILSSVLALWCRLQREIEESEEALSEDAIWDVAYGLHYIIGSDAEPGFPNPKDLSFEEAKQNVIELGAVVAYARLNISVSRGAELAELPPQEFKRKLNQYAVEPRFGPTSVEDLHGGSMDE